MQRLTHSNLFICMSARQIRVDRQTAWKMIFSAIVGEEYKWAATNYKTA